MHPLNVYKIHVLVLISSITWFSNLTPNPQLTQFSQILFFITFANPNLQHSTEPTLKKTKKRHKIHKKYKKRHRIYNNIHSSITS